MICCNNPVALVILTDVVKQANKPGKKEILGTMQLRGQGAIWARSCSPFIGEERSRRRKKSMQGNVDCTDSNLRCDRNNQ